MDDFIVFSSAKQAGESETEHAEHAPEAHEVSPKADEEAPAEVKETSHSASSGQASSKSEVINPDDIPF